jgi:ATP synthase protein I
MKLPHRQFRQMGTWANLSIVGIQFPVAIAIGYFWGRWLDKYLGTGPWMMAIFSLFGIIAGFVNLFRIVARAGEMERREAERQAREEAAGGGEDGNGGADGD